MKIISVGNLGRNLEMRYTPSGKAVINFSLAINLCTNDQGAKDQVVVPLWLRVSTWYKNAETCNFYLKQGSKVLIEAEGLVFDHQTGGPKIYKRQEGNAGDNFGCSDLTVRFLDTRGNEHTVEAQTEQEEVIQFG